MKVGVLGTGRIVEHIKNTLAPMEETERYAIASRTEERALEAAKEYGFEKAYGSYEALLQDPQVELVYIATPHSRHFEDIKLCIAHHKPVLCEKPFTLNSKQAKEIKALAEKEGVFVAEAMWPRYSPSREIIQKTIESGVIGKITTLTANLSYAITGKERIMKPELAGGALLDLGVYGLNFAFMHFGTDIERIESSVQFTDTGVDATESITLFYKDGRTAILTHSILARSDRKGIFHGEKGYIIVENINNPQSVSVFDDKDQLIEHIDVPKQITGYEYEFLECREMLKQGKTESDSMPLAETIRLQETMDSIRNQWGFVYPQEKEQA